MNGTPKYALELRDVSIGTSHERLINNMSLRVYNHQIYTIMGASGTGKSTLLAFICGTLGREFTVQGRVLLKEKDITNLPAQHRNIGILFQDDLLFPHLSVKQNLAFGLASPAKREEKVEQALVDAGMSGFGNRDPATLSGGQRARIAMMRTLLAEPSALLLDEPFNKLDASLRDTFRQFVFTHINRIGLPCLMVSHDKADAIAAGCTHEYTMDKFTLFSSHPLKQ